MSKSKKKVKNSNDILFENLEYILKDKELTQCKLEEMTGMAETALSKCKNNKQKLHYSEFYDIINVLNISPEELMYSDRERNKFIYNNEKVEEFKKDNKLAMTFKTISCPVYNAKKPYKFIGIVILYIIILSSLLKLITNMCINFGLEYNMCFILILSYLSVWYFSCNKYKIIQIYRRDYIINIYEDIVYLPSKQIKSYCKTFFLLKLLSIILLSTAINISLNLTITNIDDYIYVYYSIIFVIFLFICLLLKSLFLTNRNVKEGIQDNNFHQYEHYIVDFFSALILISVTYVYNYIFITISPLIILYFIHFICSTISFAIISKQICMYDLYHKDINDIKTKIKNC